MTASPRQRVDGLLAVVQDLDDGDQTLTAAEASAGPDLRVYLTLACLWFVIDIKSKYIVA